MAKTTIPSIKHTPAEVWAAGERVKLFDIVHEVIDPETEEPVMIPDPAWIPEEHDGEEAPLVVKTEVHEYTMPKKPNAGLALVYLKEARLNGAEVALGWLFELAIGEEAYDALAAETDFEMDDLVTLMKVVQKRALGGLESPKGD